MRDRDRIAAVVDRLADGRILHAPHNPFRLRCEFEPAAAPEEIELAAERRPVPDGVRALWSAASASTWFVDVDYGQWGLRLWAPAEAIDRTEEYERRRPDDAAPGDVVIGEFLGDLDQLVIAADGSVLVALPLDPRPDWYRVGSSPAAFAERYEGAVGHKFWE